MVLDIMMVLKTLWGFATLMLLGVLKHLYSDFKKVQDRQDALEKDFIRLTEKVVTKDSLDDILDKKMKHITDTIQDIRSDITEMRKEAKEENTSLQREIRAVLNAMIDSKSAK